MSRPKGTKNKYSTSMGLLIRELNKAVKVRNKILSKFNVRISELQDRRDYKASEFNLRIDNLNKLISSLKQMEKSNAKSNSNNKR